MLRDAFVDLLMKRLGNSNDTTLRDDIIAEMVIVQSDLLEGDAFTPWFLISDETDLTTVSGSTDVALPSDFLAPWEEGLLYRYDSTLDDPYIEMSRADWDDITEQLNYAGPPTHWDLAGTNLLMRPVADDAYPLKWRYIARGASLAGTYGDSNNIENVWLRWASDWFLGEVGTIIASQYLQRKEYYAEMFAKQAARGRKRVFDKTVAMEELLKERVIGG